MTATVAYADARYAEALTSFQRAHDITEHPDILYNIGQCADRLRLDETAIRAFEQYLAEAEVDADTRRRVQARLAVLRPLGLPTPEPSPATTPVELAEVPVHERWELWAGLGVGLAVVVAAVVAAVVVSSSESNGHSGDDVGGVIFTLELP